MRRALTAAALVWLMAFAGVAGAEWNKGTAAYKKGDFATAEKEFKEVVKTNPDHYAGYYMLGVSQLQLGKTSQAAANLRKAVELKPDYVPARLSLGQALVQAKQYREAYSVLSKVSLAKVPASRRSSYALIFASAATKAGHASEAVRVLEQQIRADSRNANLFMALGTAYAAQGNDAKAFSAFKKAWQMRPKDTKLARQAVSSAIRAGRRSRNPEQKQRYYRDAASIAESLARTKPTFDHLLLAGETYLGGKDYSKALQWFEKARAKRPNSALVHFYIGQCYSSLGKFSSAISSLQQALKAGPDGKLRRKIYQQMGYVYAKQKDFDRAITAYQNAGDSAKVAEMRENKQKQEQNIKAKKERQEFQRKIRELEAKIKELRDLGQAKEADQLQQQVDELKKALKQQG